MRLSGARHGKRGKAVEALVNRSPEPWCFWACLRHRDHGEGDEEGERSRVPLRGEVERPWPCREQLRVGHQAEAAKGAEAGGGPGLADLGSLGRVPSTSPHVAGQAT